MSNDQLATLLVLSSYVVEGVDEKAFNAWYDSIHVPDMLTIPEV